MWRERGRARSAVERAALTRAPGPVVLRRRCTRGIRAVRMGFVTRRRAFHRGCGEIEPAAADAAAALRRQPARPPHPRARSRARTGPGALLEELAGHFPQLPLVDEFAPAPVAPPAAVKAAEHRRGFPRGVVHVGRGRRRDQVGRGYTRRGRRRRRRRRHQTPGTIRSRSPGVAEDTGFAAGGHRNHRSRVHPCPCAARSERGPGEAHARRRGHRRAFHHRAQPAGVGIRRDGAGVSAGWVAAATVRVPRRGAVHRSSIPGAHVAAHRPRVGPVACHLTDGCVMSDEDGLQRRVPLVRPPGSLRGC